MLLFTSKHVHTNEHKVIHVEGSVWSDIWDPGTQSLALLRQATPLESTIVRLSTDDAGTPCLSEKPSRAVSAQNCKLLYMYQNLKHPGEST